MSVSQKICRYYKKSREDLKNMMGGMMVIATKEEDKYTLLNAPEPVKELGWLNIYEEVNSDSYYTSVDFHPVLERANEAADGRKHYSIQLGIKNDEIVILSRR